MIAQKWIAPYALAGLLCFGVASQAHAYRTAADLDKFPHDALIRWQTDVLELELYGDNIPGLTVADALQTVSDALATWSQPGCSGLVMRAIQTTASEAQPGDGANTIQFVTEGWTDRGFNPEAAGLTDVQYEQAKNGEWHIVEADVYLNADKFRWALRGTGGEGVRDLQSVITHEGGHVLGLLHVCEPNGAAGAPDCADDPSFKERTMYPLYEGESQANLSDDDIAGVCHLYSGSSCKITGCPVGSVCTAAGCRVQCGDSTCDAGEFCVDDQCTSEVPNAETLSSGCSDGECACPGAACDAGISASTRPDASASEPECTGDAGSAGSACSKRPQPKLQPFGGKCASSTECESGECLAGAAHTPVCTRSCGHDLPLCPPDWNCERVGAKQVCTRHAPNALCGVSSPGLHSGLFVGWSVVALSFLGLFRRRRAARS